MEQTLAPECCLSTGGASKQPVGGVCVVEAVMES